MNSRSPAWLLVPGAALVLAMAPLPFLGDLRPRVATLLALWCVAHAAYLAASWWVLRGGRARLAWILGAGLLARLLVLPAAPTLSEDVYRYLWDGRLVASGISPFAHAPTDPSLARFHDALLDRLNHPTLPTIYPPAAQLLFAAAAAVAPVPLAWKVLLLLLEALLLFALRDLLRARGLPEERLLLYYWNPLVIVESFGSGHLDLVAGVFLLAALALEERRRPAWAGVAFGLSVLTKYVPAIVAPAWARRGTWRLLAAAAATTLLLLAPFAAVARAFWASPSVYTRHWEFNGAFYPLLRAAGLSGDSARILLAGALGVFCLAAGRLVRPASAAALACFSALTLLSPTVYPWYLVPLVALLPLHPDPGWLVATGLLSLSYLTLPDWAARHVWHLPGWVPWVEYGGLAAVWVGAWWVRRRQAAARPRAVAWSSESPPT